ncbi:cholesterol 25-hydroxylase-like protein [Paramormyrops kingsleyae]|nr:cholesterol 25-hydroxylase-like protein [Paramormyrops kingsleyae]
MNSTCELSRAAGLLQPMWDSFLLHRHILRSPFLSAILAFCVHLLFSAPFLFLDALARHVSAVHRYRISSSGSEPVCLRRWLDCFGRILLRYIGIVLPASAVLQRLRTPYFPPAAPSCAQMLLEVGLCLLIFDTLFFIWHVLMHRVPWLYVWVHRDHHLNRDTFALAAQDASISELLSLKALAVVTAAAVGCHPLSEIVFYLLNIWLAVEDHCGYDLPWALHRLLPGFGGAPFHLAHHQRNRGNYAPYFKHWDKLCGTFLTEEVEDQVGR